MHSLIAQAADENKDVEAEEEEEEEDEQVGFQFTTVHIHAMHHSDRSQYIETDRQCTLTELVVTIRTLHMSSLRPLIGCRVR